MASETVQPSPSALDSVPDQQKFSLGASPLTIVAFLAIGIFIISIAVVFGWRRVQNQRSIAAEIRALEDVPKLWDLWSNNMEGGVEGVSVKPVAAMIISEYPPISMTLPLIEQPSLAARHDVSEVKMDLEPSNRDVTLQVILVIAMPSQHLANHQWDDEGRHFESGQLDYALGLCQCVWLREKK